MKKKFIFFISVLVFSLSQIFSQEQKSVQKIFPTIKDLSSKNPIFKQYSQDVENNYKLLAKNGETEKLNDCMRSLITELLVANLMLEPFIPDAAEKINAIFVNPIVPPETPLLPKQ